MEIIELKVNGNFYRFKDRSFMKYEIYNFDPNKYELIILQTNNDNLPKELINGEKTITFDKINDYIELNKYKFILSC